MALLYTEKPVVPAGETCVGNFTQTSLYTRKPTPRPFTADVPVRRKISLSRQAGLAPVKVALVHRRAGAAGRRRRRRLPAAGSR